ncbi:hypothetical protein [Bacterioplanoides pacificum]|uniref:Roadblock/LAMTOR2 domain-containing protein n=1 Tax=Bacterioplanoides pacificum TaxID=1171596 RepID=A0ABV7VMF0_9GAMM
MNNIEQSLDQLMAITGAMGCCIVDYDSGMVLGQQGGGVDLDLAAAGNSEVIKAKLKTIQSLGIEGDIEDMLITLSNQLHILRPTSLHSGLFIYLVLDRPNANLALARRKVLEIESNIQI